MPEARQIFDANGNYVRVSPEGYLYFVAQDPESERDIDYLSGQIDLNSLDIDYLSGQIDLNSLDIDYLSGQIDLNGLDIDYLSGIIDTLSGISYEDIEYLSGKIDENTAAIEANDDDISYLSGVIDSQAQPFDSVQFNTAATPVTSGDGLLQWNASEYTVDVHTGLGPVLQVGQEIFTVVYNGTDSVIPNGSVIYPTGVIDNYPAVSPAIADTHEGFTLGVAVATMDIPLSGDGFGLVARAGKVRDIDTSALEAGKPVYLSPLSGGGLTSTKPEFPNYPVQIGGCFESHPTSGSIELEIQADAEDTFANAWNGCFRESIDFLIESDGTTVSGILSPSNGNTNMTMCFSDGFSLLDTDPDARIVLTPGTDTNPQRNYVYVTKTNKILEVSTSSWPAPSVEHIKVADIILMSAATTQADDALKNQNWNDHVRGVDGNGHINHIAEAIRMKLGATWLNGTAGSCTVSGTPSDVLVSVTGGEVMQMHEQTFPVLSNNAGDDAHIINNFTTPYYRTTNLNTETSDALGNSLANSSFSFVLWGIINKTNENSHMMINLPTGKYAKNDPDAAVSDALNYSVYDIPQEFQSVGFLIARFTFVLQADGTTWSLYDTEDLRGKIPNTTAGGGGGGAGVTDFTSLTDTPSTYAGAGEYFVKVNSAENALEFVAEDTSVTDYLSGQIDVNAANITLNDADIEYLSGQIDAIDTAKYDSTYTTVNANSASWAGGGSDIWEVTDSVISPIVASQELQLPVLSGGSNTLVTTTSAGLLEETVVTVTESPVSGSILNIQEFPASPAVSALIAGDTWISPGETVSGRYMNFYDGEFTYSVELTR